MKSERERMLAGELYTPIGDKELSELSHKNRSRIEDFNRTSREEYDLRSEINQEVFGSLGEDSVIEPPIYIDYGENTYIGKDFYANFDCVFLDAAEIRIGDRVLLGPRVSLLTPMHPISIKGRQSGLESARPITIGDDVWLGGNTTVLPGVTIGSGSIIGAGSVVTKDIPAGVVAVGNPCRVLRAISKEDDKYWDDQIKEYDQKKIKTKGDLF